MAGLAGTGEVLGAADLNDLRFVDDRAPRDLYLITTQVKAQCRLGRDGYHGMNKCGRC